MLTNTDDSTRLDDAGLRSPRRPRKRHRRLTWCHMARARQRARRRENAAAIEYRGPSAERLAALGETFAYCLAGVVVESLMNAMNALASRPPLPAVVAAVEDEEHDAAAPPALREKAPAPEASDQPQAKAERIPLDHFMPGYSHWSQADRMLERVLYPRATAALGGSDYVQAGWKWLQHHHPAAAHELRHRIAAYGSRPLHRDYKASQKSEARHAPPHLTRGDQSCIGAARAAEVWILALETRWERRHDLRPDDDPEPPTPAAAPRPKLEAASEDDLAADAVASGWRPK